MATVAANLTISAEVTKQISNTDPTAQSGGIRMNLNLATLTFNDNSTPDGKDAWSGQVALVAGAKTLDLTALVQSQLPSAVDMTGKVLRYIVFQSPSTNSHVISIATGASNGFPAIGTISAIQPGNIGARTTIGSAAVDATHKTLDLAGTGTEVLNLILVFGTP